jgi:hypothetical protein
MRTIKRFPYILGLIALAGLALVLATACKAKAPASTEAITLDEVAAVMGRASGSTSGVSELNKSDDSYTIDYYLLVDDMSNFDAEVGSDLVPKIEKLYKTFPSLDKVTFNIETDAQYNPAGAKTYCSFDMTRRIYNQLNWTNVLAKDLFKVCKVKYS